MSFGFSIGDFLAVYDRADKVRRAFAGAPSQFKNISDEVRNLSIAIQDIDVALCEFELEDQQRTELQKLATSCDQVLIDLVKTLSKYSELESSHGSFVSKGKRVWKRLKWEPDDIGELRHRITSNVTLLNNFHGRITNQITLEIRKGVDRLNMEQDNEEKRRILDWITPVKYSTQHNDHIKERQEGTGQWLLESSEFKSWLQGDRKTLFCPGIPGAGKTILAAAVVDHLLDQYRADQSVGIAYIYCNFKWTEKQKLDDLFSSLLRQLAEGQSLVPDSVKELYRRYKAEQRCPPTQELLKVLHNVASLYPRVFILVDALDECQISGGCRNAFIKELIHLQASTGVNLFMTSRFLPEITGKFDREGWLEIRATKADVERYLEHHIRKSSHTIQEMEEEIKRTISDTVDGMFLLARIYLELLTSEVMPKKIRSMLRRFRRTPTGSGEEQRRGILHRAYEDTMERIKQQEPSRWELAKQTLMWITCAMEPLRKVELQHAITVEEGDSELDKRDLVQIDDIIAVCAGLVTIDEESDIIRLVHFTMQEYFESTHDQWFPSAQEEITTLCVTYLSFDKFKCGACKEASDIDSRLDDNALYSYAARNWGHHARWTWKPPTERILDFLKERGQVEASIQALFFITRPTSPRNYPERFTALHVVAYFGIHKGVQYLLDRHDADIDLGDGDGLTPLSWAAMNGHQSMVRLLLENGANIESRDNNGYTPLALAAEQGQEGAIKLLLKSGANIESKDNNGRTPLSIAAFMGEEAVVKLLLENGANIESRDKKGRTPLSIAAFIGEEAAVRLLLENGANIESRDNKGRAPLSIAAFMGEEAVVKLLLENGANIESKDNNGKTVLSWANESNERHILELLLEKRPEANSKNAIHKRTPLD